MKSGNENTKFFQDISNGRKIRNTIWSLKDSLGREVNSFKDMSHLGKNHFQNLFKATNGTNITEIIHLALTFPWFVNEEINREIMEEVIEDKIKDVLHRCHKYKIPGLDGWTIEFYLSFYDLIGKDLLDVVEESRREGHFPAPLNSTFIALIPNTDTPQCMDEFRPISLCNCIYKIMENVMDRRIKGVLSTLISKEKFKFLEGRQIHEAIRVAHEWIHSMKTKKLKGEILKIDLSKAYDRVNWLYIRFILTHLGFEFDFIKWVMCCISFSSFFVLINGSTFPLFEADRGLH